MGTGWDATANASRPLAVCMPHERRGGGNADGYVVDYGADYAVVTPCYVPQDESLYCCGYIGDSRTRNCCGNQTGHDFLGSGQPTFLGPLNASTLSSVSATSDETSSALEDGNATTTAAPGNGYIKSSTAIGLGVGLGVPLLIALASIVWLWMLLKRQNATQGPVPGQQAVQDHTASEKHKPWQMWQQSPAPASRPVELKATREISEVPSDHETYRVEAPTERM